MDYYPLMFNIKGKNLIFIGGGKVAERKISSLIVCKPEISVVSETFTEKINNLPIKRIQKKAESTDIKNADLLFLCTNDRELNHKLALEAKWLEIPVNIVDNPEFSDFHMPAVYSDNEKVISVSTHGQSPSLAKKIRDKIIEFLKGCDL